MCLVDRKMILPEDLPAFLHTEVPSTRVAGTSTPRGSTTTPSALREILDVAEREHFLRVLEFTKGSRRKAIQILGVSSDTFYRRMEEFGLHKRRSR